MTEEGVDPVTGEPRKPDAVPSPKPEDGLRESYLRGLLRGHRIDPGGGVYHEDAAGQRQVEPEHRVLNVRHRGGPGPVGAGPGQRIPQLLRRRAQRNAGPTGIPAGPAWY